VWDIEVDAATEKDAANRIRIRLVANGPVALTGGHSGIRVKKPKPVDGALA
jgi:hypothetical protein